MDSARKNPSKKPALIQKLDFLDKSFLNNIYHQDIQKTFQKKSSEKKSINIQTQSPQQQDELVIVQQRINQLISLNRQFDEQIFKNDQIQHYKFQDEIHQILSNQLDTFINQQADRNSILNRLQSEFNANHKNMQILEGDYLIREFKKLNQMDQQIYQQQSQEYREIFTSKQTMDDELRNLNEELDEYQKQLQQINLQNYVLSGQQKQKQFALQLIQEQYYCHKKKTRTFCIFHNKGDYDQTYQPYFKVKNSKQLSFENNELLNNNENSQINLWSSSKQKFKRINPYRCQFYKFDHVFQRKETSKASPYQLLFRQLELFIKSTLYKQIDSFLKNFSFNSHEYQLIFNQDFHENVERLRKICEKDKSENNNKLIVLISDKNRDLVSTLVRDACKILFNFNNELVEVNNLVLSLNKFQIKEQHSEDILETSYQNIEMMIDCLKSIEIFQSAHFHLRIDIQVNNNQRRTLHFLMLAPLLIENNELFCKQFKSVFKREKAFKEQIGPKIENLVKYCDKMIILTQIPEMIKNNEDAIKRISVIQNIINFQSLLVVKQE